MSVGDALKKRRTVRDCSDRSLPDSMLSALRVGFGEASPMPMAAEPSHRPLIFAP